MLDRHVGEQKVLSDSGVGAQVAAEGPVVDVQELVVQQQLLVLTDVIAELTLEPVQRPQSAGGLGGPPAVPRHPCSERSPVVRDSLDVGQQVHLKRVPLLEGLPALQDSGGPLATGRAPGLVPPRGPGCPTPTLSHMWGFSELCVFMCWVSRFCIG